MVSLNATNKVFAIFLLLLICVIPIEAKQQKEIVTNKGKLHDGVEWFTFVPQKIKKKGDNTFGIIIDNQRINLGEIPYEAKDNYAIYNLYLKNTEYFVLRWSKGTVSDSRISVFDKSGKLLINTAAYDISSDSIGNTIFLRTTDVLGQNSSFYSFQGEYIGNKIVVRHIPEDKTIKYLEIYRKSDYSYKGYMTYDGKWMAYPVRQVDLSDFGENSFSIKKFHGNNRWYLEHTKNKKYFSWIDIITGDIFIPLDKRISNISKFRGLGLFIISNDEESGVINGSGKEIIPMGKYTKISPFEYNSKLLEVRDRNGKLGILDSLGHVLIPIGEYSKFEAIEGVSNVYKTWENYKYGLIDENCKEILPCKYKSLEYVSTGGSDIGAFKVRVEYDNAAGYYTLYGKCIVEPYYRSDGRVVKREKLKYSNKIIYHIVDDQLHYSYIVDHEGKQLTPNETLTTARIFYDDINGKEYLYVEESVSSVNGKSAVIDNMGNTIIPYEKGYGYIESIVISNAQYYRVGNLHWVFKDKGVGYTGKFGLVDANFREIISLDYYELEPIKGTNLFSYLNGNTYKRGIIDIRGREIIIPSYEDIQYAGNNCIKFKQNGHWGIATTQGKVIIPTSRCYTEISYDRNKKVFAFSKDGGIKGECNNSGKQISLTKPTPPKNLASNNHSSSQAKQTSQSMPEGLLYKGYYTVGDGVDVETGMVFSGMNITNEIEIYEDYLKDVLVTANYKRTTNSGTRVYESSDPFGNPVTYYVTPSYEITLITDYYSYGFHNQVRTPYSKGQVTYSPTMNGNYGNSYNTSPNQSTNGYNSNPGLSAAQYQHSYNGYEDIVKGIFRTFEITGSDMPYGAQTQHMQTLRSSQNEMRRIRQEAASHGITIPQSYYETARP